MLQKSVTVVGGDRPFRLNTVKCPRNDDPYICTDTPHGQRGKKQAKAAAKPPSERVPKQ